MQAGQLLRLENGVLAVQGSTIRQSVLSRFGGLPRLNVDQSKGNVILQHEST